MEKSTRLIKIISVLMENKNGLTQSELAKLMGVHRSTIHRDLAGITELAPVYDDNGLIKLDLDMVNNFSGTSILINENMSLCSFLVRAMGYTLDEKYKIEPYDGYCAITGERITEGVKTKSIVSTTVGEYLDLLPGGIHGYLSVDAATVYKNTWNWGSRLIFEDANYHPLISSTSASKTERSSWSQLIRDAWQKHRDERCVALVATDFKKRVWQRCKLGVLGKHTPVYVYAPEFDTARLVYVDWERLVEVLDSVEEIYSLGYSKYQLQYSLLDNFKLFEEDPSGCIATENDLQKLRGTPEFIIALIAAQKES